jgi:hypothetical protein
MKNNLEHIKYGCATSLPYPCKILPPLFGFADADVVHSPTGCRIHIPIQEKTLMISHCHVKVLINRSSHSYHILKWQCMPLRKMSHLQVKFSVVALGTSVEFLQILVVTTMAARVSLRQMPRLCFRVTGKPAENRHPGGWQICEIKHLTESFPPLA